MVRPDNVPPATFWREHFRTHEADVTDLLTNVAYLRRLNRFADVQAAIDAYLRYHAKNAEPWLYEMLAAAIEMNKGSRRDVETVLGYAADQAIKTKRTHDMTRVADDLAIHGLNDRAGALLDRAMAMDPGAATPVWMAINLAARTRDPARMADAVERLLALGWPGTDDAWRAAARKQVEELAGTLRSAGKDAEARAMVRRLQAAERRDLVLRLTWTGDADLDLVVDEPLGATARADAPRTVFGGALVVNGYGKRAGEVYVCPRAFDGTYRVHVETIYNNATTPATGARLEIVTHEGTDRERTRTETIDVSDPKPIEINLTGGRRKEVLPYQAPEPEPAPPPPGTTPPASSPGRLAPRPPVDPRRAADALRAPR